MKQTEEPMELPRNARERIDEARPRADQLCRTQNARTMLPRVDEGCQRSS